MPAQQPPQLADTCAHTPRRCTEDAIQYVPEGSPLATRFNEEKNPITPEMEAKGLSRDDYAAICKMLREGYGKIGVSGGFSKAITAVNELYFEKIGCVACYAEYYKGCKAMVVYTKEVADAGAVQYMKEGGATPRA
jgi:hypothetical protein